MRFLAFAFLTTLTGSALAADPPAAKSSGADLQAQFDGTVKPFVGKYCVACHSGAQPTAQFDLKSYTTLDQVKEDFPRWNLLADRLTNHEMPPKQMPQPPQALVDQIVAFVHGVRAEEIRRLGGDPGIVLARRLSNAEYDNTIRDLTGQDMQVARQFPVDPANTAGFDNSGETLTMSPALLNKYLAGARQIADHMVLTPDGIDFAPHLMQVESDRDKYSIQRIIAFYKAQDTDFADYFQAAWRYRYRAQLGHPKASLASTAADAHVSAKYLPMVWGILHDKNAVGPVAKLEAMWNALPAPGNAGQLAAKTAEMRDFVTRIRAHTAMQFYSPKVTGLPGQSEPLHNWRLQEYADNHTKSDPADIRADNETEAAPPEVPKYPPLHEDASPRWAAISAHARFGDPDLVYPAGQKAKYQKAFDRFAAVFPDAFYVSERGRYWPDQSTDNGRLLSAGYHNTGGYYRDDTALMQLILDKKGQDHLNRLWNEFDFIAHQTERTWVQYFFNQSGEVDGNINGPLSTESGSKRPVGHEVTDEFVINQMRDKYLARWEMDKAHNDPVAPKAFRWHFGLINATLRGLEKEHVAAEPKHLTALLDFAQRAYRRPLTATERTDLLAYYKTLRAGNRLSHEDAVRDCIVSVLMSPDFLYRFDMATAGNGKAALAKTVSLKPGQAFASEPLSDYSLASRLSYFLWASMPDAELLRHAAAGDLHKPAVLLAETHRMLKDPKVRGLATEFTGNWLVFRQFETNNSVDRMRFPAFDDDLREAMFQEPIHLMQDNIQNERSVLDLLYGNYTFVNPPLARHYGMPEVKGDNDTWMRVDNADKYGRGGILPMAVFMTAYSPGLRTSPVKRGNWVVQKVLGIRVPPPPPVVPELPSDESKTDKPIREMLAEHHKNPFCAGCHLRFDSFGLAFEGYGPVGDARAKDLAGRPIDASTTYPGGVAGDGLVGLKDFIKGYRQDNFVSNLARKLMAYALNRSPQLSDEALVDKMKANLAADGYKFRALVDTIVVSPQFLNRRITDTVASAPAREKPASPKLIKTDFRKEH